MTSAWITAGIAVGIWLLVVLLQLGDVATAFLDSRTARDRDVPGRIARERTHELFWVIPVCALVALGIGLGLDYAARAFFDSGSPSIGGLFVLGLAVLVVGIGALALAAVAATDPISYSALRRDLREIEGERITATQLTEFRARLSRIDARARNRVRPTRVPLTRLLLTTQNILRLAAVVFGLVVVAVVAITAAIHPTTHATTLVFASLVAPVLSGLFAALAIRFSVTSDAAWRRVFTRQRVDILKQLEIFDRSTRKGVAGLGDRVTRALKILNEQQPK